MSKTSKPKPKEIVIKAPSLDPRTMAVAMARLMAAMED